MMRTKSFVLLVFVVAICSLTLSAEHTAFAGKSPVVREVWKISLAKNLQGRVYETAIFAEEKPVVVASTPEHLLRIDGEVAVLLSLKRSGRGRESAILPSPAVLNPLQETLIGILVHDHHAIRSFKLISPSGRTITTLDDPRHFHYRLAPDGRTFVGIDAHGQHVALAAESLTYRFFNQDGKQIGEVESSAPQPNDSSFTPDGKGFLINSKEGGLSLYAPAKAERIWNIPVKVKFFALSNAAAGRVLVSHEEQRNVAELYEAGQARWRVSLEEFGAQENVRNLAIAPSGAVAAVSGATQLLILGPESGKPSGVFRIEDGFTINSLAVSDRGFVAVGAQQAASGKVVVLNSAGEVVFQQDTKHQRTNAWIPIVQFDASGRLLLVRTLESLNLLAID